jgi:hypothetical protein
MEVGSLIIDVIKSKYFFSFIFGSIGGLLLSLFINYKLKYWGVLSSSVILREIDFYYNDYGVSKDTDRNNAEELLINFDIEFYNGTETQKCVTDIRGSFYKQLSLITDGFLVQKKMLNVSEILNEVYIEPKQYKRVECCIMVGNRGPVLDEIIKGFDSVIIEYQEIQHKKKLKKKSQKLQFSINDEQKSSGGH